MDKKIFIKNRPFDVNDANDMQNWTEDALKKTMASIYSFGIVNGLAVSIGTGLTVNISAGSAFDTNYDFINIGNQTATLSAANTSPRIDKIVIKYQSVVSDNTDTSNTYGMGTSYIYSQNKKDSYVIQVVKGTAASNPVAPATPAGTLLLAEITVPANAVSLVAGNIVDRRTFISINSNINKPEVIFSPTSPSDTNTLWIDTVNKVPKVYLNSAWSILNSNDADTLDGKHASDFALSGHNHDTVYYKKTETYSKTEIDNAFLTKADNLLSLTNKVTARANLGLGSASTFNTSDFAPSIHTHDGIYVKGDYILYIGTTAPSASTKTIWWDTTNNLIKIYNGTIWVKMNASDSETVGGASKGTGANNVLQLDSGGKVPNANLNNASTTGAGIVQLNDTITNTSKTQAATANAVKQVVDWVKDYGIGGDVKALGAIDVNTISISGLYNVNSSATNTPGNFGFQIIHMQNGITNAYQIALKVSIANEMYFRRYSSTTGWESWKRVATTDDITNEKINFLGTNIKKSSDLASTYPNGITGIYITSLTQGFPTTYGYLLTTSYNTGASQTYYGAGGDVGKVWIRSTSNGDWSDWIQLATTDKAQMAKLTQDDGTAIRPISGTDLNTIKATGIYYTLAPVNGPVTENGYLHVVVGGSPYLKQIYLPYNQTKMFVRDLQSNGTTWTPWTEFATTDKAQMAKITGDDGTPYLRITNTTTDVLAEILKKGAGFYNLYTGGNAVGMPTTNSFRGFVNFSTPQFGSVMVTNPYNEWFVNFYDDTNGWRGWDKIVTDKAPVWKDLVLANGVQAYSTGSKPQYCKIGNVVYVRGAVKNILTTNVVIGTLDAGFRPGVTSVSFATPTSNNNGARFARWSIDTYGVITMEGTSDNATSAGYWYSTTMSFVAEK